MQKKNNEEEEIKQSIRSLKLTQDLVITLARLEIGNEDWKYHATIDYDSNSLRFHWLWYDAVQ